MTESAVLFHSHSFAAPLSRTESYEDNTNHALSQSVSFGRFMSENLEWGRWSSFSHKKYVDEAEKFSQPGSVAQKKAFFEAHYKKIAEAKKAKENESSESDPIEEPESVAVLLNTLDTLTKNDVKEEESDVTELALSIEKDEQEGNLMFDDSLAKPVSKDDLEAVLEVLDEMEMEEERNSLSKNVSVCRPSLEKSNIPEKISENPIISHGSVKKNEKPAPPRFSFLNFFIGNNKTQDQNSTRKKDKKPKKQFLCLCFQPEMVGEEEAPTRTQRRSL